MRFAFSFIIVFASAFHYAHAQNLATPVEYLSYVSEQGRLISDDMMAYTSATSHNKSARKVEKKRLELMQTIKQSVFNMRRLKPFKGDHALRDSTLAYFQIVSALLNEDLPAFGFDNEGLLALALTLKNIHSISFQSNEILDLTFRPSDGPPSP